MESNVYYNPEAWGLSVVADIEYSDGNYQFDTRVVWRDSSGSLYTARDYGCSCPMPFEDYKDLASLERVDLKALEREVHSESTGEYSNITAATGHSFLRLVEREFRECPRCGGVGKVPERDYICEPCRYGV